MFRNVQDAVGSCFGWTMNTTQPIRQGFLRGEMGDIPAHPSHLQQLRTGCNMVAACWTAVECVAAPDPCVVAQCGLMCCSPQCAEKLPSINQSVTQVVVTLDKKSTTPLAINKKWGGVKDLVDTHATFIAEQPRMIDWAATQASHYIPLPCEAPVARIQQHCAHSAFLIVAGTAVYLLAPALTCHLSAVECIKSLVLSARMMSESKNLRDAKIYYHQVADGEVLFLSDAIADDGIVLELSNTTADNLKTQKIGNRALALCLLKLQQEHQTAPQASTFSKLSQLLVNTESAQEHFTIFTRLAESVKDSSYSLLAKVDDLRDKDYQAFLIALKKHE